MSKVAIVGSGSWGLTLAVLIQEKGHRVTVLCRRMEKKIELETKRIDPKRLGDFRIPDSINFTIIPKEIGDSDYFVFAIPSQHLRDVARKISFEIKPSKIISVIKGIESKTFKTPSEILKEYFPSSKIAVLTGPSIAREVLKKIPTSVVVASEDTEYAKEIQNLFHTGYFRVYHSSDVKGCELGGAIKNVIAIAAGILDGLGFGANTKGALIVRGAREMMRLGEKLGANPLTFSGLSGIGDLITTCFSPFSRNRIVGEAIARGKKPEEILKEMDMVAEGIETSHVIKEIAKKVGVEVPVVEYVHRILIGEISPQEAINAILNRPPKPEFY